MAFLFYKITRIFNLPINQWVSVGFVALFGALILPISASAQLCSCASPPSVQAADAGTELAGTGTFSLSWDLHHIGNLYDGSDFLSDDDLERSAQNLQFSLNYGLTDRISTTVSWNYVEQKLITSQTKEASGFGDLSVLGKYQLHAPNFGAQYDLSIGAGVGIPTGDAYKRQNSILLQPYLQPGSGVWSGILWGYFHQTFLPATNWNLLATVLYQFNDDYQRFPGADTDYHPGNQLFARLGTAWKHDSELQLFFMSRFRHATRHKVDGNEIFASGGSYLLGEAGVSVPVLSMLVLRVSGRIPVWQHVNGTQPATSWGVTAGISYQFQLSDRFSF
jgi:hypothetical protein